MPRFEWLRPYLEPILREHPDRYWLCYQILERLQRMGSPALAQLESQYGTGYGKGGGAPYRPDNAISQCLADWTEHIDVQHLLGQSVRIGRIEGSAEAFGIFRWK